MSDLISRSALLSKIDEDIKSTKKWMEKIESDIHNKRYDILNSQLNTLETYRLIIEEQPTAYDVEKVVELLKYKADVSIQHHFSVEHNVAIRVDDAIAIVRKGGVNENNI